MHLLLLFARKSYFGLVTSLDGVDSWLLYRLKRVYGNASVAIVNDVSHSLAKMPELKGLNKLINVRGVAKKPLN